MVSKSGKPVLWGVSALLVAGIAVLILYFVPVAGSVSNSPPHSIDQAAPQQALMLPAFSLSDSSTGSVVTDKQLLGRKFLLNVWASWCVSCRREHDFLLELASEQLRIVGLDYLDKPAAGQRWLDSTGNPYVFNLLDVSGELGGQLPVLGTPETYFIDSLGKVQYKHSGIMTRELWVNQLAAIYQAMK